MANVSKFIKFTTDINKSSLQIKFQKTFLNLTELFHILSAIIIFFSFSKLIY